MNLETIRGAMHPVNGDSGHYDALLEMIGDAHLVLIGEASHGMHEFYRERAKITKRLIPAPSNRSSASPRGTRAMWRKRSSSGM